VGGRRSSLRSDVFDFFFVALLLEKEEPAALGYFDFFFVALLLEKRESTSLRGA
jgi:hypothetical protein